MQSNYSNLLRNPSHSFCLFLILLLSSCVEEYTNNPTLSSEILIVDGLITNQLEADTVEVSYSQGKGVSAEITPLKNCKLTVTTDNGKDFELKEDLPGKYYTPQNLVKQIGKSYRLKLTVPNGGIYESTFEKMSSVPPILKVYDTFDPKVTEKEIKFISIFKTLRKRQIITFSDISITSKLLFANLVVEAFY
jgi:hypothetical protein